LHFSYISSTVEITNDKTDALEPHILYILIYKMRKKDQFFMGDLNVK